MDFRSEWLLHFARDISKSVLKKKVTGRGNYLWHIFSWNLIDKDKYLIGDSAKKAFDKIDKSGAKYFWLFEDEPSLKELEPKMDSHYIDKYGEFYVVSSDWTWTYINTHEDDLGPYFFINNRK